MAQATRTFRIFVSSTFSDLKEERNALQKRVFPKLRNLCMQHGCRFQAIDLRWGVRVEAALDQQTMNICFEEIARCQKVTPRPNFIVLLGDRYGWCPLPYEIPANEFQEILRNVRDAGDRELLAHWYRRDDNAVPPVYDLQPRTGKYVDSATWEQIECQLRSILLEVTKKLPLEAEKRLKYTASATEQEIVQGALKVEDAPEHVFCFFRTIQVPQENRSICPIKAVSLGPDFRDFVDLDPEGNLDKKAHAQLNDLKNRLSNRLSGNIHSYQAKWTGSTVTTDHIDKLCEDVYASLARVIEREVANLEEVDPLDQEFFDHDAFGKDRARFFTGRTAILKTISAYVNGSDHHPLAIFGASGSGKTALMAKAVEQAEQNYPDANVIIRFIGATPGSSDGRTLLESLCHQISRVHGMDESAIPSDYRELVQEFPKRLVSAIGEDSPGSPIRDPQSRIQNRRGECLSVLERKLLQANLIELYPMPLDEGADLLGLWLKDAGRTLQEHQWNEVTAKFAGCGLPLYLKLAFEEARRWKSYDQKVALSADIPGIIRDLFNRLSSNANHGKMMVSRSLGYLAAAKNGLTEDELLDVLSLDEEVLRDFTQRAYHEPPDKRLPVVVWSRLYFDLEPYLTEHTADGTALMTFYHRQLVKVVNGVFLAGEEKKRRSEELAGYFEYQNVLVKKDGEQAPNYRKLSELPYLLQESSQWSRLAECLTEIEFLREHCFYRGPYQLLAFCEICLLNLNKHSVRFPHLSAVRETLCNYSRLLHREPGALAQQLYLTVNDYWGDIPTMTEFSQKALLMSSGPGILKMEAGTLPLQSPLFRDFGVQEDFVPEIDVSADFGELFSASMKGQLRRFDILSGQMEAECVGAVKGVPLCLKAVDGDKVLVGLQNGQVVEWSGGSDVTCVFHSTANYSVNALALTEQEDLLVVGPGQWDTQPQPGTLFVLNIRNYDIVGVVDLNDRIVLTLEGTWQQRRLINPDRVQVNAIVPRPHSRELAFAFHHGEVSLFNIDTNQWRRVHSMSGATIYGIGFDSTGDQLFFAYNAGILVKFDMSSWSVADSLSISHPLTALTVAKGTEKVILGDQRGTVYVIRSEDLVVEQSFPAEALGCVRSFACDSSGALLIVSGRALRAFYLETEAPDPLRVHDWAWHPLEADCAPELKLSVATNYEDTQVTQFPTGEILSIGKYRSLRCARKIPLAVAECEKGLKLLSLPTLEELCPIEIPDLISIHGIAISQEGAFVACIASTQNESFLGTYRVPSDMSKVLPYKSLCLENKPGYFVPLSISQKYLKVAALSSKCGELLENKQILFHPAQLIVWELASGSIQKLTHPLPVRALKFSPDGNILFIAPGTQYEYLDVPGAEDIYRMEVRQVSQASPTKHDFAIRAICLRDEEEYAVFEGHTDSIIALDVSADGHLLASVSEDLTLRIWEVDTGKCIALMGLEGLPLWCGFGLSNWELNVVCRGWRADLRLIHRELRLLRSDAN